MRRLRGTITSIFNFSYRHITFHPNDYCDKTFFVDEAVQDIVISEKQTTIRFVTIKQVMVKHHKDRESNFYYRMVQFFLKSTLNPHPTPPHQALGISSSCPLFSPVRNTNYLPNGQKWRALPLEQPSHFRWYVIFQITVRQEKTVHVTLLSLKTQNLQRTNLGAHNTWLKHNWKQVCWIQKKKSFW